MLAVGILGTPFIGYLQESTATKRLQAENPAVYQMVTKESDYLLGKYQAIDPDKAATVTTAEAKDALKSANTAGQFRPLGKMTTFLAFNLWAYLGQFLNFNPYGVKQP